MKKEIVAEDIYLITEAALGTNKSLEELANDLGLIWNDEVEDTWCDSLYGNIFKCESCGYWLHISENFHTDHGMSDYCESCCSDI